MKKILLFVILMLCILSQVSAIEIKTFFNMNMTQKDIYNAKNINASAFYDDGVLLTPDTDTDTNESTRFNVLVATDCTGTDKVIGVDANGAVSCGNDELGGGGGSGISMWVDGGSYMYPYSSYAANIKVFGYIQADDWSNISQYINDSADARDSDTTYSESDYYLTLISQVFGINKSNLNSTIIAITDERDTDTTYTNSSWNLGSIPGTITTVEVSNYSDSDTTYVCSDWSACTDNSLWDANKLDGQLGSYYLDDTDTNESTRVNILVGTDCPGTDKVIGINVTGGVLCASDIDTIIPDTDTNESVKVDKLIGTNCGGTDKMVGVNATGGVECSVDVDTTIADTTCDGETCEVTNTGTLDGYEASALLDDTDTNESVRFDKLTGTDCPGTDKVVGINSTGGVLCTEDIDNTIADTDTNESIKIDKLIATNCGGDDKMVGVNATGGIECGSDVDTDEDTTYSENDYYLTESSEVFGVDEGNLNTTIIAITDERDADTNTQLSEAQVEGMIFDIDNSGTMITTGYINATDVCVIGGNCLSDAGVGSGDITAVNTAGKYITGGSGTGDVSLLVNETELNDTIIIITDARDTDTDTTYTNESWNLESIPGSITTSEVSNWTDTDTTYVCSDWSACSDDSLWDADKLDGEDGAYYLDDTDTWRTTIDHSNVTNLNATIIVITDARDTDTTCDSDTCDVTNTGTLDGYEASALLDDTDTNESVRFGVLVGTDCPGTDKVVGINSTGGVLCTSDVDTTIPDTDCDGETCEVTNTGTLDGYEASALLDDTDTNESTRFDELANTDCPGTQKVIGVNVTGGVLCSADIDTTIADTDTNESTKITKLIGTNCGGTDKMIGVNATGGVECGSDIDTDIDTTYTNGTGLTLISTEFSHSDTSSQASSDNSGRTYIQDVILDTFGHITSIVTGTETVTDTDTNESTRIGVLVGTDCPGTDKVVGINATGGVLCTADIDTDTDTNCNATGSCSVGNVVYSDYANEGNLTLSGFVHTGVDDRGHTNLINSAGDVVIGNRLFVQNMGMFFAPAYGPALMAHEYSSSLNITSLGGTATLTASNQFICDSTDPFFVENDGMFLTVISSTPSFTDATGEITDFLNSTCIRVGFGSAGGDSIVDASDMTYYVYPKPTFSVLDNGDVHLSIGENKDTSFRIDIANGTNKHGVHIADIAGTEQHSALEIEQDMKNFDSFGLSLFSDSSTGASGINYDQIFQEIRVGGISDSEVSFINVNVIGEGTNNDIDLIHITGDIDHIIHQGSTDSLTNAYTEGIDETVNFNTNGAGATLFDLNNDFVYVGAPVNFTTISFALDTHSNKDLRLDYFYCDNTETWKILPSVTDTTDGMQISGTITFINPSDRGVCNKQYDGTPFANTTKVAYISIERTLKNVQTEPIESLVTIGGSETLMFLQSDMMKLEGSNGGPETCTANYAGAWYYDSSGVELLWCDGTAWTAFATTAAPITVHNNLGGLDGGTAGEYYHLTLAQHTIATQSATSGRDGYLTSTDWTTFNNKVDTDTDTNESTRFGILVGTDCPGTQKVIGINSTGGVLCSADIDTTIPDTDTNESVKVDKLIATNCGGTDKMIGVNVTGGVECAVDVDTNTDTTYSESDYYLTESSEVFGVDEGNLNTTIIAITDERDTDTNTQLSGADVIVFVGNWSEDKPDYYTSAEVDTELEGQDECSEITGCVENAITSYTDTNDNLTSVSVTGTTTKTITFEQDNQANISAVFTDIDNTIADTDTNESVKVDKLIGTNCAGTNKMIGVNVTGGVECGSDVDTNTDTTYSESDYYLTEVSEVFGVDESNLNATIIAITDERDTDTNTDTQDLSYDAPTNVISLVDGGTIDISEVDTDTTYINASFDLGSIPGSITTAEISNWTDTDTTCDSDTCEVTNTGTLDGYEASALLDDTDTNESTRVDELVGTDCPGTDKVVGINATGGVLCTADLDTTVPDTDTNESVKMDKLIATNCGGDDKMIGVNTTGGIECGSDVDTDTDTTYSESDYYLTESSEVFGVDEGNLNTTIIAITDERDTDTDTTYSSLSEFDNDLGYFNSYLNVTLLKDLVAGDGLQGGADDVLVGTDADVTINIDVSDFAGAYVDGEDLAIDASGECAANNLCGGGHTHDYMASTLLGDIVAGDGLQDGADDVLPGIDADVTINIDVSDFAGAYVDGEDLAFDASGDCGANKICGGGHTHSEYTDTNESTRLDELVTTDCPGTDKMVGVNSTGGVLCTADIDTTIADTDTNVTGCTDCIGPTEITDDYLLDTGDTGTGNYVFTGNVTIIHNTAVNETVNATCKIIRGATSVLEIC